MPSALGVREPHHLLEVAGGACVVLLGVLDEPRDEARLGEEVALVGHRRIARLLVGRPGLLAHQRAEPQGLRPGGPGLLRPAGVGERPAPLEFVLREEEVEPVLVPGREGLVRVARHAREKRLLVRKPRAHREQPLHGGAVIAGALRPAVEHLVEGGERGVRQPKLEERLAQLVAGLVLGGGHGRVAQDVVEGQRRRLVGPALEELLRRLEPLLGRAGGSLSELEPQPLPLRGRLRDRPARGRGGWRGGGHRHKRRGLGRRGRLRRGRRRGSRGGSGRHGLAREVLRGRLLLRRLLLGRGLLLRRPIVLGLRQVEAELRPRQRRGEERPQNEEQPSQAKGGGERPMRRRRMEASHGSHCTGRFSVGKKKERPSSAKS